MGGPRVPKDDLRVAAYGDVDETNAAIGAVRATAPPAPPARPASPAPPATDALLEAIQRDLFAIGGALATPEPSRLREEQRRKITLAPGRVAALEAAIDAAEEGLPPLRQFVLPGGAPRAAALHLARAVCRRAERSVVRLAREQEVGAGIVTYLNRLSDLLFVLARAENARAGQADVTW